MSLTTTLPAHAALAAAACCAKCSSHPSPPRCTVCQKAGSWVKSPSGLGRQMGSKLALQHTAHMRSTTGLLMAWCHQPTCTLTKSTLSNVYRPVSKPSAVSMHQHSLSSILIASWPCGVCKTDCSPDQGIQQRLMHTAWQAAQHSPVGVISCSVHVQGLCCCRTSSQPAFLPWLLQLLNPAVPPGSNSNASPQ